MILMISNIIIIAETGRIVYKKTYEGIVFSV